MSTEREGKNEKRGAHWNIRTDGKAILQMAKRERRIPIHRPIRCGRTERYGAIQTPYCEQKKPYRTMPLSAAQRAICRNFRSCGTSSWPAVYGRYRERAREEDTQEDTHRRIRGAMCGHNDVNIAHTLLASNGTIEHLAEHQQRAASKKRFPMFNTHFIRREPEREWCGSL